MFNISPTQLKHCPSSDPETTQSEMHSLPRALQNPCGHKTGKVKSRGVGHDSPPECKKWGISILWNPTSISAVTPFDGGCPNRQHAAQGSATG